MISLETVQSCFFDGFLTSLNDKSQVQSSARDHFHGTVFTFCSSFTQVTPGLSISFQIDCTTKTFFNVLLTSCHFRHPSCQAGPTHTPNHIKYNGQWTFLPIVLLEESLHTVQSEISLPHVYHARRNEKHSIFSGNNPILQ